MVCAICNDTGAGIKHRIVRINHLEKSAATCGYCQIILNILKTALPESSAKHVINGFLTNASVWPRMGGICYRWTDVPEFEDDPPKPDVHFNIRDLAGT
jgi:hypothetical protein